jgi:undecaprenyl-diphosphatase
MYLAERVATQRRSETQVTVRDALVIGILQCVALIPGVSRSGATISGGLFVGLNRVAATRLSFFLSIPALVAAGGYEAATSASDVGSGVGWLATGVATVVSFAVAYASIAWLLRFVAGHPITYFVGYRLVLAGVLIVALSTGALAAV